MNSAEKRLLKDLEDLQKRQLWGIIAKPVEEKNLLVWKAFISGPPGSPYENGSFELKLTFDVKYPITPPTVKFEEELFHPNIYNNGSICLDILQDKWVPTFDVAKILLAIQNLLVNPNPESPANGEAARLYNSDKGEYGRRVRQLIDKKLEQFALQMAKNAAKNATPSKTAPS